MSPAKANRRGAKTRRRAGKGTRSSRPRRAAVRGEGKKPSASAAAKRRVEAALARLRRSFQQTELHGAALVALFDQIEVAALEKERRELARALLDSGLLDNLVTLREGWKEAPPGPQLAVSSHLQHLPVALLNWMERSLDLRPHLKPGQQLEIPVSRLADFDLEGTPPERLASLVRIKVISCGWKRGGRVLRRPAVELSE